jgi:hypothetical protein
MKRIFFGLLLLSISTSGFAAIITDLVGDMDGFGIGATHGSSFDWQSVGPGDGDGTDVWSSSDLTLYHNYDLTGLGPITSVSLEVFTGGQGYYGLSSIYLNDQLLGTLTDGDTWDTYGGEGQNIAWLDVFDLSSYIPLFTGSNSVTIDVNSGDGWVMDYSRLIIETAENTNVPEPGTLALLGLGLAGIRVSRGRKQVK